MRAVPGRALDLSRASVEPVEHGQGTVVVDTDGVVSPWQLHAVRPCRGGHRLELVDLFVIRVGEQQEEAIRYVCEQ